ncbi:E3 ubiquitin-protein ligase RNF181-like [Senna tora]|uniref:RING-type E3 ubiquitin transferase n=1 Tax=Senna tora TaxID=362788 RepID=A0A834T443_9FABA|nr:E3 ubiquitin-protein ligase RNF181-like [Senna tora]
MASEPEVSEISPLFESFTRNRELALFLPFIFGFSSASPRRDSEDPHQETENPENPHRQRVILINPFTQGMMVIDGGSGLDALFREMGSAKNGRPPATKESIEAMGSVEIGEGEDGECAICLEEWEIGGVAKEMPCKHKFHGNCIEKWLGIHGNCPVCRYEMPVEEKEVGKKDDDDGDEGEERRRRQVWVSFSFRNGDQNQAAASGDSIDSSSTQRGDGEVES